MKKKVLFIHSAGSQKPYQGSSGLIAYLKEALGSSYDVLYPKMPNPEDPEYTLWKEELAQELEQLDGRVILIGHSLGGSVLFKYLSEELCRESISGLFSIAAPYWGKDKNWQRIDFVLQENFATKLVQIPQIFLYHSVNDSIVPFSHLEFFAERLPQANIRPIPGDQHLFHNGLSVLVEDIKNLSG
ncbi:alpha/beta hydrolase [Risungbinella massiliensis]|uniref:alpha/beta hydrolase n=1 Tax=Risungbinella massiliensis TaxID=1329796 RepID=UPI0005CC58AC|nr:alpha/beta hydrolase [Risungbinella massiliensis]